jgi:hypothetical protein
MGDVVRLRKTDYGIEIVFTVRDNQGTALDISSASSVQLKLGRRGETTPYLTKTMGFVGTGTDGMVKVSFLVNDLATPGYYDAEILVNYATGKRNTKPFTVQIIDTL